jgi:acyl-CoA thioester hydrolase
MKNPAHRHKREVTFGETDASGWMHFANVFRCFEEAEHAFLRKRGVLVFDRAMGGWPRVKAACEFRKPLRLGDRIEVHLKIARVGATSVGWLFEVLDSGGGVAAAGSVTTVRVGADGMPRVLSDDERAALAGK